MVLDLHSFSVGSRVKLLIIKCFGLIACIVLSHNQALSQNSNHQLFDFYDNQNGLSQGSINAIVQDKYGYMWFGSQDGLNRFDGINFKVYKNELNDANSISDNYITAIIEDDQNDLWIGTRSGGLNKYDIETGEFTSYKFKKDNTNSLANNRVTSLAQGIDGIMWIGTSNGMSRLDTNSDEFTTYRHNPDKTVSISSNDIKCLLIDINETLWIGTSNGLNKFDSKSNEFTMYIGSSGTGVDGEDDVLSIWEDEQQNLWLGTNGGGLKKFIKRNGEFTSYLHPEKQLMHNDIIMSLLGEGTGKIWVGTDGGYLNLFDPVTAIYSQKKVVYPRINSLYKDDVGDLWVGMRGGINKIGKYNKLFIQYSEDQFGKLISPNGDLHALAIDNDGFIWTGSSVDGVKKINRETLEVVSYVHSSSNSLSNNNVRFIYIDDENVVWIATQGGLNRFDIKTNSFKVYLPEKDNPNSISSVRIDYIYEDQNNNLWICTNKGISILDKATEKFTSLRHNPENSNSLFSDEVSNVTLGDNGMYWIGFRANGFDRYDPIARKFKHFSHEDTNENSLSNDRVFYIHDDKQGNLWIPTYGGGLNKFNKETETFTHFGEVEGLANTSLYCVMEDENHNLWMSHNEGFSRFDPVRVVFNNYFKGVEFNGNAFCQTKNGEILFGSYNVVSFFPRDIVDNDNVPPVYINQFKLFNEIIQPNKEPLILSKTVEEIDTIVLAYDQNFFSFGFVSLNYTHSENNRYKYILENFDQDWNEASEYANANYTNVPPGNYTFRVIGSNNDLVWNEKGDFINIQIVSPWWQTLIFKLITITLILGTLIVLYKLRLRNIKQQKRDLEKLVYLRTEELQAHEKEIVEQNEQLVALNEEKNELIQIVSHDLRSPLNQIKGLASIVKMINPNLNEETRNSMDLIDDLVDRQRIMISKILDTNAIDANKVNFNISKTCVNTLIEEVVNTLQVVAANKNIEVELSLAQNNPCIEADGIYLIKVIENLLSNSIKFSQNNTVVTISTRQVIDKVHIGVKDEGPGISAQDMKFLFERYTKLSAKPTADEESTGLGLSIAKKYVDAMHGKIWCESDEGKGASFILEFDLLAED